MAVGIGVWYWQEQQRLQRGDRSQSILRFSASSGKSCFAKKPEQEVKALTHYLEQANTASMKIASQLQVAEAQSRLKNWGKLKNN